jgi:hypothetical protein
MAYRIKLRETHMRKHYKSDSIEIKFTGGDASAGNGAKGYNSGDITNTATMNINPYNKAEGGDVHTNTGDQVDQKAGWDPTTQTATQTHSGNNTSGNVDASASATQTNMIWANQNQYVWAGVGGDGGDHAKAYGGDGVDIDLGHIPHLV